MRVIEFETARLAKLKGFDCNTFHWYNQHGTLISKFKCGNEENDYTIGVEDIRTSKIYVDHYLAPTQAELKDWLLDTHNIFVTTDYDKMPDGDGHYFYSNWQRLDGKGGWYDDNSDIKHRDERDAFEIGLVEGLKLINETK